MTDDEDDDAPAFPWLMAIPAITWTLHGLFLLGFLMWIFNQPLDPDMHLNDCLAAFLIPSALLFFAGSYALVRGQSFMVVTAMYSSIFIMGYFAISMYSGSAKAYALAGAISMLTSFSIMIHQYCPWYLWKLSKDRSLIRPP